ncbi:ATP-binding protein [Saccharothrix stipae]
MTKREEIVPHEVTTIRNEVSADSTTSVVVQAGAVHGGLHFHSGPRPVVPRQLPPRPDAFAGRVEQLNELDDLLRIPSAVSSTAPPEEVEPIKPTPQAPQTNSIVSISIIGGAGGIGKTWLAVHWAHMRQSQFPDGQLFVDLRGFSPDSAPMAPEVALHGFLNALGVEPTRIPDNLQAQAGLFRSIVAQKQMLILLDNAANMEQVVPLLPGQGLSVVVVTSRKALLGLSTRYGAQHLTLGTLRDDEAHAFLTRRLGAPRIATEPRSVRDLIRLCGAFPLALGIVAGRAGAYSDVRLSELVMELAESRLDALEEDDPHTSLSTVLSWSYQTLTVDQRSVFGLLGIAPGPDIGLPAAITLTGLPSIRTRQVLRSLEEASLINRNPRGRYSMHDLIRHYAAEKARQLLSDSVRTAALRRVVDFYLHTAHLGTRHLDPHRQPIRLEPATPACLPYPLADSTAAMAWFDAEHHCVLAAQKVAAESDRHTIVWQLAWTLDLFHWRRGHRRSNREVWQAGLISANRSGDHKARTLAYRLLGVAYLREKRLGKAVEHLEQALTLARQHGDRVSQAHVHRTLADTLGQQGDYRPALNHATRALQLYGMVSNPVRQADTLNQMGRIAMHIGDYGEARQRCQEALAISRSNSHQDGEADALKQLADIDHNTGYYEQALQRYRQALVLYRKLDHSYATADTLANIGLTQAALGKHEQARQAWLEAVQMYGAQQRTDDVGRVHEQLKRLELLTND